MHCCDEMDRHTGRLCEQHSDPFACGRHVIAYSAVFDEYGLIIHDGGRSSYRIRFCPFCGRRLPECKRERWFAELEALGFDAPSLDGDIPEPYKSDAWYRRPRGRG